MKVYRVTEIGLYGNGEERFFLHQVDAEAYFSKLIEEKKADKDTLSDEAFADEGYGEANLQESKFKSKGRLRCVQWAYEVVQSNENGTEYYSHHVDLVLEEIQVQDSEEVKS